MVASLSFHSAITGLTLGLEEEASGVWINLAAIASHKFVIAFSVGVEMVSSKVCTIICRKNKQNKNLRKYLGTYMAIHNELKCGKKSILAGQCTVF